MFKVYKFQIKEKLSDEGLLEQLPMLIRQKIRRRRNKKCAIESLVGYLLLQQMLKRYTTIDLSYLCYQESGKPYFEGEKWYLNISHSQGCIVVALSDEGPVGVDIEHHRDLSLCDNTYAFFSAKEASVISTDLYPELKVIEYWSKKEALIKAVGGQMFDMANYTDVTRDIIFWNQKKYFLYQLGQPPPQHIWLATTVKRSEIRVKYIDSL